MYPQLRGCGAATHRGCYSKSSKSISLAASGNPFQPNPQRERCCSRADVEKGGNGLDGRVGEYNTISGVANSVVLPTAGSRHIVKLTDRDLASGLVFVRRGRANRY